jgi:outer membrane receptor protein involved in Fe transport
VEDTLRNLPQVFARQNANQSYGSTGTATVNLRGLGEERTLVLVNGRRLPAGSPLQGGVGADLNQIPGALIESVDVLTGGASATYGSDAVAGVVNFRLMDDFEGVNLRYQFSQYQHDNDDARWQRIVRDAGYETADGSVRDGAISNASLIMGRAFAGGRGNVTAYATYRNIEALLQGDRDYSSCALSNDLSECFGSATQPQGTFSDFGLLAPQGLESFDYKVEGDRFVPRDGTTFNYAPSNHFQRPDKRWTAGLLARFDLRDRAQAYTELMFMDNRSVAQIAPSGNFFLTDTLRCGNAFLSEQQFDLLCGRYGLTGDDEQTVFIGRRNVEGGPRQDDLNHASYRGVFGLRGNLTDLWQYDLHYLRARVEMERNFLNDMSSSRISRALDAVRDPDTGRIVCRSTLEGSDPDCVPWNIFQEGAVTQSMIDYLTLPLSARGSTDQTILSGYVAGNLGDYGLRSPFATAGPDVVVGGEYRSERLEYRPDDAFRSGDGAGQGGASQPVSGGFEVAEFFVEAGVPVVHDAPYADEVVVDGGYRYSEYDYGKQTDTFAVRASWAVNADLRLRASVQRATRGPNVRERYLPQGFALFDMNADPCGGPVMDGKTAEGRTLEECARSGVTAAQFGNIEHSPANQYNFLQGGTTELSPEDSDTYAYGFVWTPSFASDLTFSLDFYSIEIRKGIRTVGPAFILNQCLDGNTPQCAKVKRGRSGDLWLGSDIAKSGHIVSLLDNLAVEKVQGYDLTASYALDIGDWGRVRFSDVLSITSTWDQQELLGAPTVDCAGNWGSTCGSPKPALRNNLRATWLTPWRVRPALGWRYIGGIEDLNSAGIDLGARHYFDLSAVWDYSDRVSLRVGINNLFDKSPPIAGSAAGPVNFGNGNTFPGLYDVLGRFAFIALSIASP